jgi:hypothetical protein
MRICNLDVSGISLSLRQDTSSGTSTPCGINTVTISTGPDGSCIAAPFDPDYTYQWFNDNGIAISGATSSTFRPSVDGYYYVEVCDPDIANCCENSGLYWCTTNVTILDAKEYDFNLFPNPTSNKATVSLSIMRPQKVRFSVFDVSGKLISTAQKECVSGKNIHQLEMRNVAAGIYHVVIEIEEGVMSKELVLIK